MFNAERIVSLAGNLVEHSREPLRLYWLRVPDGNRDELATEIESCRGRVPIVPVVLRQPLFRDPNTIPNDIHQLLADAKKAFDGVDHRDCAHGVVIVVLARNPFDLPQVGSPVVLPDWFPRAPRTEVFVRIADFGEDVEAVLLNADEVRREDLASRLCCLERALVKRLRRVAQAEPRKSQGFFDDVRGYVGESATVDTVLHGYLSHVEGVQNPQAYRPTVKDARPLSSHLIRLTLKSSPDDLSKVGGKLASALDIPPGAILRPPLFAVLLRPATQIPEPAKSGHSLLLVALIYSTSRDLRRALADAEVLISALDVSP